MDGLHATSGAARPGAKQLFQEAMEVPPEERPALLLRRCQGDAALRTEVEALLRAASEMPAVFMQRRPTGPGAPAPGAPRFRFVRELGRGGQGSVDLVEDLHLHRLVALKRLESFRAGDHDLLDRFRREAEVASRLRHPGICTVYEAGSENGVPFIAMEYVEGETLARPIARARSEPGPGAPPCVVLEEVQPPRVLVMRAVEVIEHAARALQAAHVAGVLHRDVKPGNIMVTKAGAAVVVDFGLARELESDLPAQTRTGDLFGTPAYMSPEQLSRQRIRLDPRTDVWSLGATLYECLTLRRAFEAASREAVYQAILRDDPPDPLRLNPSIPKDLRVVIDTALEKDRGRRYQSALGFAEDLRRVRGREPILARPVGPWTRFRRWVERNPAVALFSVTTVVSLITGVNATGAALVRVRGSEKAAMESLDAVRRERAAGAIREYGGRMTAALAGIEIENTGAARGQLDAIASAAPAWEWRAIERMLRRPAEVLAVRGQVAGLEAEGESGLVWSAGNGEIGR